MTDLIIDYAWGKPNPVSIKEVGYKGVARYLSPDASKNLSLQERDALLAQGLSIVLVWEWYANRIAGGAAAGAADGRTANAQADILGYPKNACLYYACDFDAQPSAYEAMEAYLRAAGAQGRTVGIYGGLHVVEAMLQSGAARYGWQTVAWSQGKLSSIAHLYQRIRPTLPSPGGSYDEDIVLQPYYGQWGSNVPVPTPTPVPINPPKPGPKPVPVPPAPPKPVAQEQDMKTITNPDGTLETFTVSNAKVMHEWFDKTGKASGFWELVPNGGDFVGVDAEVINGTPVVTAIGAFGDVMVSLRPVGKGWSSFVKLSDFIALTAKS